MIEAIGYHDDIPSSEVQFLIRLSVHVKGVCTDAFSALGHVESGSSDAVANDVVYLQTYRYWTGYLWSDALQSEIEVAFWRAALDVVVELQGKGVVYL